MYTRRLKHKFKTWGSLCRRHESWVGAGCHQDHAHSAYILGSETSFLDPVSRSESLARLLGGSSLYHALVGGQGTPPICSRKCEPEIARLNLKHFGYPDKGSASWLSTVAESAKDGDSKDGSGGKGSKVEVGWIDRYLPKMARPYAHLARLDKPIGTWLLAWPCMW